MANTDTENFLVAMLWADGEQNPHWSDYTVHEFHPGFHDAVTEFVSCFRDFIQEKDSAELTDALEAADDMERTLGGNVYFALSGHGVGLWDSADTEPLQAALEEYAGGGYSFEQIDLCKFKGKIHLAYRTAAFRREYLAKMFAHKVIA